MKDAEINDKIHNLEENEEDEAIDIKFTEQKADTDNDKNMIDFKWSDVKGEDEEDIAKANLIKRELTKASWQGVFF